MSETAGKNHIFWSKIGYGYQEVRRTPTPTPKFFQSNPPSLTGMFTVCFQANNFYLWRVFYCSLLRALTYSIPSGRYAIVVVFSPVSTFPVINQLEMSHNSSEKICVTFCEARLATSDRVIEHKW